MSNPLEVSIHASSREDATQRSNICRRYTKFQSTRPRGRTRLAGRLIKRINRTVSIHASSREDATSTTRVTLIKFLFQSTRPRGRTRHTLVPSDFVNFMFQSTRPRGRTRRNGSSRRSLSSVSIHASSREDATSRE